MATTLREGKPWTQTIVMRDAGIIWLYLPKTHYMCCTPTNNLGSEIGFLFLKWCLFRFGFKWSTRSYWKIGWFLWYINPCSFFNVKSCFIYIYIWKKIMDSSLTVCEEKLTSNLNRKGRFIEKQSRHYSISVLQNHYQVYEGSY